MLAVIANFASFGNLSGHVVDDDVIKEEIIIGRMRGIMKESVRCVHLFPQLNCSHNVNDFVTPRLLDYFEK